jgi:hypothetical protein
MKRRPFRPALLAAALVAAALALPGSAEDMTAASTTSGGPVAVSVSYSINENMTSTAPEAVAEVDARHRKALLLRAEGECEAFLATIATDCAVSSISLATQLNSYPGQPPTIYVSSTVTLQIAMREGPAP